MATNDSAWLETQALCTALAISRSTLGRWRRRGLLTVGHHWVKKNPAAPRSDLLWHHLRCSELLCRARQRADTANSLKETREGDAGQADASELADYVFLHRDTGAALYVTRASASEIHRANRNLSRAGNRNRYVPARHLMDHCNLNPEPEQRSQR
jgi:hypothetical protein